ncbi:hypothetical protein DCC79_08305 [bacterium]|nr:GAF domain-containing protein [Chloroflexi bacterium CFX6]RIL10338.1 MAG: hypothetical protein DCC79_08305 [bacterium]
MVVRLRHWLLPPVDTADGDGRVASLVGTIARIVAVGMALYAVYVLAAVPEPRAPRLGFSAALIVLEVGVHAALRAGSTRAAVWLQTLGLWAVLVLTFSLVGGIAVPGVGAFLVLVAMASLLLEGRARAAFAGLVLATVLALGWADARSLVPVYALDLVDPRAVVGTYALLIGVMAAFMYRASDMLNQALHSQQTANAALRQVQRTLEHQVAQRTAELEAANARLRREIDERTQALDALRHSEEKHRLLLDSIQSPVLALQRDMTILYCNDAYAAMVGLPMAALEGQSVVGLFPQFAATNSYAAFERALATGEASEVEGPFPDGRILKARVYPTPWGVLSVAEDVTERRRIEHERVQFANQLRTAAETASRLSAILDPAVLLDETVQRMQDRFDLYHVHVYLVDPATDDLVVAAGTGEAGRALVARGHRIPRSAGRSLVARAAQTRDVVLVDDVASDPAFLPNPLLPETRSEVAVPLIAPSGLVGVLDVQDDQPGRFSPYDVDTYRALAGQVAVALANARSFEVQRQTEARLREAQLRLDTLFRSLPQVLLYETGAGRENIIGDPVAMLGYPSEAFVDDRTFFPSLIHPDDQPRLGERLAQWSAEGRPGVLDLEFRCRRADGEYAWIHDYMVAVQSETAPPYQAGVLVDVTDRRAAEEERSRFIEQLRTAADVGERLNSLLGPEVVLGDAVQLMQDRFALYHVHVYLYDRPRDALVVRAGSGTVGRQLVDERHTIPLTSERSIVAFAAATEDLVHVDDVRRDRRFLPNPLLPDTRSEVAVPLVAREGLVGVLDVQDSRPGRFTPSELDTFRILAGQIAVALENARVFEELKRVADRLKEVDRLKSEFLANMSHELRTPLNSIIGYAELILMGINGELDGETLQDVQAIYDNGQQLLALINDLLDLAKIEAGRMRLEVEDVLIGPLLEEVRTSSAGLLLRKPIDIALEVDPSLPALQGDRLRLQQILNNLVSNAVKFTDEGHIWLRAYRDADHVVIDVEDTGIGIPARDLATIFEKFRQADGSLTRRARGTGLGLAITHHLVRLHEGRIDVESSPGQGTRFSVRLPITAAPPPSRAEMLSLFSGDGP